MDIQTARGPVPHGPGTTDHHATAPIIPYRREGNRLIGSPVRIGPASTVLSPGQQGGRSHPVKSPTSYPPPYLPRPRY